MKKSVLILTILFFAGCSQKNKIPKGILSQKEMTAIMWDMMRTDEYFNFTSNNTDSLRRAERISMYEQIYRLHATNQEVFKKSISFYQSRPDLFKVISDSLRTTEKKVYEEQNKAQTPVLDSVNKKPDVIK